MDLSSGDLEETLDALRQVRVLRLFNQLRTEAEKRGFLSETEVEAEIRAARAKMKTQGKRFSGQGCS